MVLLHVFVEVPLYGEGPFSGQRTREFYQTARAWVDEHRAPRARTAGARVRALVRSGSAHREIVAAAEERVGLIVLATHGRGGLERALLGSVADRVIRTAPCPVLSVRPAAA